MGPEAKRNPPRPAICLGDTAASRAVGVDVTTLVGWGYVLWVVGKDVILAGHDANHLRLAYDGYQEPYANTCLNWDTAAVRKSPLPGK